MNLFGLIPLAAFLINGFTFTYIYAQRKRSPVNMAFFFLSGAIGCWLVLDIALYMPVPESWIIPLLKAKSVFWLSAGFLFLNFTVVFIRRRRSAFYFGTALVGGIFIIISLGSALLIQGYRQYGWGVTEEPGPLFKPAILIVFFPALFYAVLITIMEYRAGGDRVYKNQLLLLMSGACISVMTGFTTDYLLPHLMGMDTMRLSGASSVPLSFFTYIAVLKYRFLSPGVEDLAPVVFDFFNEGSVVIDPSGRVLNLNRGALKIFNLGSAPPGLFIRNLVPGYPSTPPPMGDELQVDAAGGGRKLSLRHYPLPGMKTGGRTIIIVRDITRQRMMEDARLKGELFLLDVFSSIQDGLVVMDNDYRIIRANPTVERWGADHMPLVGKKCHEVFGRGDGICENCPGAVTLRDGVSSYALVPRQGQRGWLEVYSFPLVNSTDGSTRGVIEYMRDITGRLEYERRIARINETFLGFTADPARNINALTTLCGELLDADGAFYNRLDRGSLHSLGRWNIPDAIDTVSPPEGRLCYNVIQGLGDGPVVVRDLRHTPYGQSDPAVGALGIETYVGIKVRMRGAAVGSLCAVFRRDFSPTGEDVRLLEIIAVAVGIEEERMHMEEALRLSENSLRRRNEALERDMRIARHIQKELIPRDMPDHPAIMAELRYEPMESVGGDYFSFFSHEGGDIGVFIGDVANHGVSAALFLALVKATTDRIARLYPVMPGNFLSALNNELLDYMPLSFLTAIYGFFRTTGNGVEFTFASAGHPDPILYRASTGEAGIMRSRGPLLGQFSAIEIEVLTLPLGAGDRLYLYTDGLPDSTNTDRNAYGYEGLRDLIARSGKMTLPRSMDFIMVEVGRFRDGAPIRDDMVLLGFEILR